MYFISSPGDGRFGLLKLLNIASNKRFLLEDVIFGVPQRNENDADSRNTKVVVDFKGNKGYYGSKTIYYNRTHISTLPALLINRNGATTYYEVINTINSDYNLYLTQNDIIDGPLPDIVSDIITVTLPLQESSFKFYGGAEIEVDPFEPDYVIYKPTDTLLGYICIGFDRWAQYMDEDGSVYQFLIEPNSYDCGFDDINPRIIITRPSSLTILEEEVSDIFTVEYINPDADVVVTVTAPGLTISQSTFNLSAASPTGTFTVTSNVPGVFNINISNDLTIPNPIDTTFTFLDRYTTTYGVEPPNLSAVIRGVETGDFVVTGYAIDPDEPVTVTIHTQNGLVSSVTSVLLTAADPEALFRVTATNQGTYGLSFTNNRGLDNPAPMSITAVHPGTITLTAPSVAIADGIQSGLFVATLVDGAEAVTVTPSFTGTNVVVPTSFILSPSNPTGSFRVTYDGTGLNTLSITNSGHAVNPDDYEFVVLTKPTLIVTPPVNPILSGTNSDPFTITMVDGYRSVTVTLTTSVETISTTSIVLTPSSPTATFTVRDSIGGNYYVSFSNNGGLDNPDNELFEIIQTYDTYYDATPPAQLNLVLGQPSNNFTVTGYNIDPAEPITVTITPSAGLTTSQTELVLTAASPTFTFTAQSDTEGSYTITLSNDRGLDDPGPYNVNVIDPGYLTVDVPTTDKFVNQFSDLFTVTLVDGYQPIVVTLISPGATFTPTTLNLSPASPIATFAVRYGTAGEKTVSFSNNGITINPTPVSFPVHLVPTITVTPPSGPVYEGLNSGNFTITLVNGYKSVNVTVSGDLDTISGTTFELTPAEPVATFTVTEATAGNYTLSFSNDEGYSIPATLNVTVIEMSAPTFTLVGPSSQIYTGENSGNFTVTLLNPIEPVEVTVQTDADFASTYTINLSPGTPSATFTVRYDDVGNGFVGIINDMGYTNPSNVEFTIIDRPPASLSLIRTSSDPALRNVNQTFQVTITNPFALTTITPYVLGGATISGSFNLSENVLTGNISMFPANAGTYEIGITNNQGIDNPPTIFVTVINGEILLRVPNTNLPAILQSDWFEVELVNYNTNTIVDLGLLGFEDGTVFIDPTDVYQTTRIMLTSGNRIGRFRLTKATPGTVTLSITNTQLLANPESVELTFFAPPQLTLTEPSDTEAFLNTTIGDYTLTLNHYTEDTNVSLSVDPLFYDPYRDDVVLFLDFQGNVGESEFRDLGIRNYTITGIYTDPGTPGVVLSDVNPVNGFVSAEFLNVADYLRVIELNSDFRFTANFSIEVDFRTSSAGKMLLDMNTSSGSYWYLWINMSGQIEWRSSVTVTPISSTVVVNDNVIHRVLVNRVGTTLRLFLDGVIVASFTSSSAYDSSTNNLYIGAQVTVRDASRDFVGFIGKVKITKGAGRYTENYTAEPLKIGRLIPPTLLLNGSNLTDTFELEGSAPGQYQIVITNDADVINPASVEAIFQLTPTLVFTPATGPFYIAEESFDFVITLLDPSLPVTFTLTKDAGLNYVETPFGLTGDSFTLDASTPTTSFTLQADALGTYSFVITNDRGLTNPGAFSYTVVERTGLALGLDGPTITNIEAGRVSDNFTVTLLGTEIQDVLVTPAGHANLTFVPSSFLLNQSNKVATFTVTTNVPGEYQVTVNNDGALDLEQPEFIDFTFREKSAIVITDEPRYVHVDVESGNFTATLTNPYEPVTVTPVLAGAIFTPPSLVLSPATPSATFTILFDSFGYKTIVFETDPELDLVDDLELLVYPTLEEPYITLEPPNDLYADVESSDFILTLHNGPWWSYTADNASITADSEMANNPIALYTADTNVVTADSMLPIDCAFIPMGVDIVVTSDAETFSQTTFTLDPTNNVDTFTLLSEVGGTFEVSVDNDSLITNPAPFDIVIGTQLAIELTAPTEPLYKTKYSWPFTVTVPFLNTEVIVTPICSDPDAEFIPETITLTPGNNTGTFRLKSSVAGIIDVGTVNNVSFADPVDLEITVTDIDEFYEYTEWVSFGESPAALNRSYNGQPLSYSGSLSSGTTAFYPSDPTRPSITNSAGNSNSARIHDALDRFFDFKGDFTFEIILRNLGTTGVGSLISFNHNNTNGRGLVIVLDQSNRRFIVYDRLATDNILYATPNDSVPPGLTWIYTLFQCVDGILRIYVDGGSGTTLIGETPIKIYDLPYARVVYVFGPGTGIDYPISGTMTAMWEAIRFTSKARYTDNFIGLSDLSQRFITAGAPSLRLFKPHTTYVDKNILSKEILVTGYNLVGSVTVTPVTIGDTKFIPESAVITSVSPSATFVFVSNETGIFNITLNDDSYIDCKDSFDLTVIPNDTMYNDTLLLLIPNGSINDNSVTAMKDASLLNRTLNKTVISNYHALKSDFARFDKAIDLMNFQNQNGFIWTTESGGFNFNNVNFTIEGSCYLNNLFETNAECALFCNSRTSNLALDQGFRIIIRTASRKLLIAAGTDSTYLIPEEDTPGTIPGPFVNFTFTVEYIDGTLTIYINGEVYASAVVTIPIRIDGGQARIGISSNNNNSFIGGIDQFRITKGAYRYGGPHTPTALPFAESSLMSLTVTPPSRLDIFDTETSFPFTVTAVGIKDDCNVTIVSNISGLTFTPSVVTLTKATPTNTFTITGDPGEYELTFENSLLIDNSQLINFTVFDSEETILDLDLPAITQGFVTDSINVDLDLINPVSDVAVKFIINPIHNDPYLANIVLAMDFQGVPDSREMREFSSNNFNITVDGPNIRLEEFDAIYGRTSLRLGVTTAQSNGTVLIEDPTPGSTVFDFPGDFTFEIDFITYHAGAGTLFGFVGFLSLRAYISGNQLYFGRTSGINYTPIPLLVGVLQKVTISRTAGVVSIFNQGVLLGTTADNDPFVAEGQQLVFGGLKSTTVVAPSPAYSGVYGKVKITKGVGKYISNYTPEILRYPTFTPSEFVLDSTTSTQAITVQSSVNHEYSINIVNDRTLQNPDTFILGYHDVPEILFTPPGSLFVPVNDLSDDYVISLVNPSKSPVTVTVVLPVGLTIAEFEPSGALLSGSQFLLDEDTPSVTINFTSGSVGTYPVSITNNRGLPNPTGFDIVAKVPDIFILGPNPANEIYVNEPSFDLTVGLDVANSPITVVVTLSAGLSFDGFDPELKVRNFICSLETLSHLFKITSTEVDTVQDITITNLDGANNPSPLNIYVVDRPGIPNNLETTDYDIYLVGEDTVNRDINLFQGFF